MNMTVKAEQLQIVSPSDQHTHTIILLHGRDSNASEFATEFLESQASDDRTLPELFPNLKWVFPTSKIRASQRFQGIEMSQWFDIWSTENPQDREELQIEGLTESVSIILEVIRQEMDIIGAGPNRIILGGISQGCAAAIYALFSSSERLGRFVGFCGWLPLEQNVSMIASRSTDALLEIRKLLDPSLEICILEINSTALRTPVFLTHSVGDPVVSIKNGQKLSTGLKSLGMAVERHSYDNDLHWITEPKGVDDLVAFLKSCIIL
jgi:lysophospholipase-2